MKLKQLTLAVAFAAVALSSGANAATTGAAASGSSVIFSAWNDTASYSLDLSSYLNTLIGADTATSNPNTFGTPSGTAYSGSIGTDGTLFNIKLTDFNLSDGVWNLAASDTFGRSRILVSETDTLAGLSNGGVKTVGNAVGTYIGLGAATSTTAGTLATATDPWYAGGIPWGDDLGSNASLQGTANTLGSKSNLVVAWATSAPASNAAAFANFTAGGYDVFATTYTSGADTFLKIGVTIPTIEVPPVTAVPEPESYAMMLAGLAVVGAVARRRAKKA